MTTRVRLTYEDYAALPDAGRRYELHEGELSVTPAPGTNHQATLRNLVVILDGHVAARGLGEVFPAPMDCILENSTVSPISSSSRRPDYPS
jgi:Uma2 family endonuclease